MYFSCLRGHDFVELRDEGAEEGHGGEESDDTEYLGGMVMSLRQAVGIDAMAQSARTGPTKPRVISRDSHDAISRTKRWRK